MINIGISDKGSPINTVKPFKGTADVINIGKQIWLKSGIVEANTTLYPHATSVGGATSGDYTLVYEGVSTKFENNTIGGGICASINNAGRFWNFDRSTKAVSEYNSEGVLVQGTEKFIELPDGNAPFGIGTNDISYFLCDNSNSSIREYDSSWDLLQVHVLPQEVDCRYIDWDAELGSFWVLTRSSSSGTLQRYDPTFTTVQQEFNVSPSVLFAAGIMVEGGKLFVGGYLNGTTGGIFEYTKDGVRGLRTSPAEVPDPLAFARMGGGFFWLLLGTSGAATNSVYKFSGATSGGGVGLPNETTDTASGLLNYMRVD